MGQRIGWEKARKHLGQDKEGLISKRNKKTKQNTKTTPPSYAKGFTHHQQIDAQPILKQCQLWEKSQSSFIAQQDAI